MKKVATIQAEGKTIDIEVALEQTDYYPYRGLAFVIYAGGQDACIAPQLSKAAAIEAIEHAWGSGDWGLSFCD